MSGRVLTRNQAETIFWVGYVFGLAFGIAIGACGFWWYSA